MPRRLSGLACNTVHLALFFGVLAAESVFWSVLEICEWGSLTFFVSPLVDRGVRFAQVAGYRGFRRAIAPSGEATF